VKHPYVRRDGNLTFQDRVTSDAFSGTPSDKLTFWFDGFGSLERPQPAEFHVQARPLRWVEFRDVALQPRHRSKP
jgi:hypothetical protein